MDELTDVLMDTLPSLPKVLICEMVQYITPPKWVHAVRSMLAELPFEDFENRFNLAQTGVYIKSYTKCYNFVREHVVSVLPRDVISGALPDITELCYFEHEFIDPLPPSFGSFLVAFG